MKKMTIVLLSILTTLIFSQEKNKKYFFFYTLNFDKTDNFKEEKSTGELKENEFYFVVTYNTDNLVDSVGYYDVKGNINTYLIDRYNNIFFNYITYKYEKGLLKTKEFKNKEDKVMSKIDFEYTEEKKISKTILFTYSIKKRELIKIEETKFTYKDNNYDIVERINAREQIYEKFFYNGKPSILEYYRYNIDGKTLQYSIKYYYDGDKLVKKEFYSKAGVLIKTEYEKSIASKWTMYHYI